jgi:hypothetical protein
MLPEHLWCGRARARGRSESSSLEAKRAAVDTSRAKMLLAATLTLRSAPSHRTRATVEMLGNAPSAPACKARAQPSAHPLSGSPTNRTLSSGVGSRLATMACDPIAPRMGFDPISTRLDKPPSTPADSRGISASPEGIEPSRAALGKRPPNPSARTWVTYGFRSRQGHVHSVPGSPAPSRHSQRGRNRTCMISVPSRVDSQYPTRWCTPSVSSRPLRVFSAALSPDQLEVRS